MKIKLNTLKKYFWGKNQCTVTIKSRQNQTPVVNNSVSNVWNPLMMFWNPPKCLGHFSSFAFSGKHSLASSRLQLTPPHCCWLLPIAVGPTPLLLALPNCCWPHPTAAVVLGGKDVSSQQMNGKPKATDINKTSSFVSMRGERHCLHELLFLTAMRNDLTKAA